MSYPKLTPIIAKGATEPRYLEDRFADVVNVKDFGAKGDGETDDTTAIQAAINTNKPVYVPIGTYMISSPILLPSGARFYGCGDKSVLKAVNGYNNEFDVICNAKRIKNTDYTVSGASQDRIETDIDTDIIIWDICIDGNVWDGQRYLHTGKSNSGCGIMLSGVRNAIIDNVTVKNSMGHAINITDTYVKTHSGNTVSGRDRVFNGYCQNIQISNCTVIDPYYDDAITTHITKDCLISNCRCIFNYAEKALINNRVPNSGIEIDDGSENISVVNCFVEGFECGFNAKGHSNAPGIANVSFVNMVVKNVTLGFMIAHAFSASADTSNYSYDIDTEPSSGIFVKNTLIDGLEVVSSSYDTNTMVRGFQILQVRNVFIDGLTICNINPNVGFENQIYDATKVSIKNVTIKGQHNVLANGATTDLQGNTVPTVVRKRYGLFNTGSSSNFATPGLEFENINVDEVGHALNVIQDMNGITTKIDGVHLLVDQLPVPTGDNIQPAVINLSYGKDTIINNITTVNLSKRHCVRLRYHYDGNTYKELITDYGQEHSPKINTATRTYYARDNNLIGALVFDQFSETHPNIRFVTSFSISGTTADSANAPNMYEESIPSGTDSNSLTGYHTALYLKHNNLCGATAADGGSSLGRDNRPWTNVYATTGSWAASDMRLKDNVEEPSEALMRAWGKVNFKIFQMKDAIEKKGEDARLHVGVIAQEVQAAFASEGLDARRYGLFGYAQWEDEYDETTVVDSKAVYDKNNNIVVPEQTHTERVLIIPAGDKYSIRYSEALALECAYQRWRLEQLEERINQLTNPNN